MIYWMKNLPDLDICVDEYIPFIKNSFFRKYYMWFVYALMIVLLVTAIGTGGMNFGIPLLKWGLLAAVFIVHEVLHIIIVYRKGDIYLTHSGLFFWLTPNVQMLKWDFWLFMTFPFIVLTIMPAMFSMFFSYTIHQYLVYVAWINAIIASSDIINSILILSKPSNSVFYRGVYKVCLTEQKE